jgi:hypothetical protein
MSKDIALCYSNNNTYPVDRNNQQELANFKQDNPHITGSSISIGTPFILRSEGSNAKSSDWRKERPDLVCSFDKIQSLSQPVKKKIALMGSIYGGENLQGLADFYQAELLPMIRNESVGTVGAASTAFNTRLSSFAKAANTLVEALEDVREGAKAKLPRKKMTLLELRVRGLRRDFNNKFQVEIEKYVVRAKHKNRTTFSDTERGIYKAKSSKGIKPIQFTSTTAFQNLRAFEKGANVLGRGLLIVDAGVRVGKVHNDYLVGRNWQRKAAVEATGFGFGAAAGLIVGAEIITTGLSIAMLATPVGWVFVIGSSLALGILAAKGGDALGQLAAEKTYDLSTFLNRL